MTDMRASLIVTADASSVVLESRKAADALRDLRRESAAPAPPPQTAVDPSAALRREMAEQQARANRALADSLTPVIAADDLLTETLGRQQQAWMALEAALNPVIRAERELAAARQVVQQAQQSGIATNTQAARALAELEQRYHAVVRAQSPAAASAAAFERAIEEEERSVRALMLSLDPAARAAADFTRAQDQLTRAVRAGIITQDEAARSMQQLEAQQQAVGRGGFAMAGGLQNVSFQMTDLIVQVQSGQAASVALAQQLPQLLGGFGAIGAVLGLAAAAAVPLISMLTSTGEAAGSLDDRLQQLETSISSLSDYMKILRDQDPARTFGSLTGEVRSLTSEMLKLERAAELKGLRATLDKLLDQGGLNFMDRLGLALAPGGAQLSGQVYDSAAGTRAAENAAFDRFTGGRGPSAEEFASRRANIETLAKAGQVEQVVNELDALLRRFAAGGPVTEINDELMALLQGLGKVALQTAEIEAEFNGTAAAAQLWSGVVENAGELWARVAEQGAAVKAEGQERIRVAENELALAQVIAQHGAESAEAEAERDRIARENYDLELERAGLYGEQRDRLLEIWDQQNGVSDATAAWADTMSGVRSEIEGILAAIASLGGGLVDRAAKQAELKALEAGATIADAAAAGRATRRQAEANATAMQLGGGMFGRAVAGVQSWWQAGGDALETQLSDARSDARERARTSRGGTGGGGVGFAASIKDEIARLQPSYEADIEAAEAWRDKALAGLKKAGAGYADFADDVERIYKEKLAKAYEADLQRRDDWAAGVERANMDLRDDMLSWADVSEDLVTGWAKAGEDAFVSFARTGKAEMGDLLDFVAEAFARMAYQQMIQPGLSAILGAATNSIVGAFSIPDVGAPTILPTNHTGSPGVNRSYKIGGYGDTPRANERLTMMRDGEQIMTSRALENAGALISALSSAAAASAAPMQVDARPMIQVVNQSSAQVTGEVRETTDQQGRKQYQLALSDAVATGLTAPGGAARRTLAKDFGISRRGIQR